MNFITTYNNNNKKEMSMLIKTSIQYNYYYRKLTITDGSHGCIVYRNAEANKSCWKYDNYDDDDDDDDWW